MTIIPGGTNLLSLLFLGLRILNPPHKILLPHSSFIRAKHGLFKLAVLRINKGLAQISPSVRAAVLLIILDNSGSIAGAT